MSKPACGEEFDRQKRERKGCWGTEAAYAKYEKQEKAGQAVPRGIGVGMANKRWWE